MSPYARSGGWFLAAWLTVALLGCEGGIEGVRRPNEPPQTSVTALPLAPEQTGSNVHLFWNGTDADGRVTAFEWRLSDNGADGRLDVADTLDLAWHATVRGDTTFSVKADLDSFPPDVEDAPSDPRLIRSWRSYTFMVRAVDNEGARDPTPDLVNFTATTLAPIASVIDPPPDPEGFILSRHSPAFRVRAADPDGLAGDPLELRFVLLPAPTVRAIDELDVQGLLAGAAGDQWSPWMRQDAQSASGVSADFPAARENRLFLFAVQARDLAGAVTPTFRLGQNVIVVEVRIDHRPLITVWVDGSTCPLAQSSSQYQEVDLTMDVVGGQPFDLSWTADTSRYDGGPTQTRYGWDVAYIGDDADPGWRTTWSDDPELQRIHFRESPSGRLFVQARDRVGGVSTLVLPFPTRVTLPH